MLTLKNISKNYQTGSLKFDALNGVSVSFRKSEFVSILGPSGCGKTTLLNIIGGLDRYTSGDLVIDGKSTKKFTDKDWDTYRNHAVGFVFQSYNLIPHQTVLQNVELALTLSGVDKQERKKRAIEALNVVGLGDKLKNKPNQLSGGQMQRVAIARALVNNPEIVLADEPTGALDTESSVQIMDLLKEVSKTRLVVMVTHNPELAEKYSTRIVRLLDGQIQNDSDPFTPQKEKQCKLLTKKTKKKRMSFFTALSLSFKNLLTKKARTILVSVAGSIGIIGIALVLSISTGFNTYVNQIQKDTLSSYPVELSESSYNMSSLVQMFFSSSTSKENYDDDKVHTKNEMIEMLKKFNTASQSNDLKSFKQYVEGEGKSKIENFTSAIQYSYGVNVNAYYESAQNGLVPVNPTTVYADTISSYDPTKLNTQDKKTRYGLLNYMFGKDTTYYSNEFWCEMIDNQELLNEQYDLMGTNSHWPTNANEVVIVLDEKGQITDYTLFGMGLLDQEKLMKLMDDYINNSQNVQTIDNTYEYDDLVGMKYKLILESAYFEKQGDKYLDIRTLKTTNPTLYKEKIQALYNNGIEITVSAVVKPKPNVSSTSITNVVGYTSALTNVVVTQNNASEVVQTQLGNNQKNVVTGEDFEVTSTSPSIQAQKAQALANLGYVDLSSPSTIYLYPTSFDDKAKITSFIEDYNKSCLSRGEGDKVVTYSYAVGDMMSSVSTIISSISYVLIAFVSVSLIVSSIMIGVITYISVIERTKEIGVLRSVGASKRDIKRVFTAESFIIGLASGALGIIISLILLIPINIILKGLTNIATVAILPWLGAIILVVISIILTFIAGLIPARAASRKDPVIALRTE